MEEYIIYYYKELYLKDNYNIDYDVIIEFDIILNKDNDELFIDKITYTLDKTHTLDKEEEREYKINLNLKLGDIFCFINHFYLTMKYYNKSIIKLIFFNEDTINYCLKLTKENNLLIERNYKLCKNYLKNINEILLYYINKGLNELNICNVELDEDRFNYIMNKFNKYVH